MAVAVPRAFQQRPTAAPFAGRLQVPVASPTQFAGRPQTPVQGGYGKGVPGVGIGTPIPPGYFDPTRDIELATGKREGFNTIEDIGKNRLRGEDNYTTALGQSQQNESHALEELQRASQRLAGRQAEQQNVSGTLYGGAALAAAARRAENLQRGEAPVKLGAEREQGHLSLEHLRGEEDLGTQQTRTENALEQYGIDTNTLKTAEAVRNGYVAPGAVEQGRFPLSNPLTGENYRQFKQGARTVHEYANGKKVVLRG